MSLHSVGNHLTSVCADPLGSAAFGLCGLFFAKSPMQNSCDHCFDKLVPPVGCRGGQGGVGPAQPWLFGGYMATSDQRPCPTRVAKLGCAWTGARSWRFSTRRGRGPIYVGSGRRSHRVKNETTASADYAAIQAPVAK